MGRLSIVDVAAPPERLAAFRITTGLFTIVYLLLRLPVYLRLRGRDPVGFDGEGVFELVDRPLSSGLYTAVLLATLLAAGAFLIGWRFRFSAPIFAIGLLVLTSYRSSWGQLLHFEHLFVLHVILLACSPAADAWSLDAWRRARSASAPTAGTRSESTRSESTRSESTRSESTRSESTRSESTRSESTRSESTRSESTRYGWPLRLAALIVVITYVIAGVAKLRYGGTDWIAGDTLRNHIAYSATRLDVLGGSPSPLAASAVRHAWLLPPMAAASVLIELAAPLALLGGSVRNTWIAAAWLMHLSIFALMLVGFPYPLFLAAFAPFFRLDLVLRRLPIKSPRVERLLAKP